MRLLNIRSIQSSVYYLGIGFIAIGIVYVGLIATNAMAQDDPEPSPNPKEDAQAEETPSDEAPSEKSDSDESPPDQPPADDSPSDQPQADEPPPDQPQADQSQPNQVKADKQSSEQAQTDESPSGREAEGVPSSEATTEEASLSVEGPIETLEAGEGAVEETPVVEDKSDVDTIVVTGQFREQSPQDTPLAVTAIDSQMLEDRGQENIAEVANQAPNVRLSPGESVYGPALQAHIRGIGQHDFNYALEPGVGVYVDDVYYSTLTGSIIDLLDLDRVEIYRGPQGTLAGQNSIGGAIKLYSKPPDGQGGGYVKATYGDYNRTEIRGAANFTVIDKKLFGRVAGVGNAKDGYVIRGDYRCTHPDSNVPSFQISDQCELGTEGGTSYAAARASLRILPIDKVELNLIGDYTNDNSEATPTTLLYFGTLDRQGLPNQPGPNLFINEVPIATTSGSRFITYSPYDKNAAQDDYTSSPYIDYSTYTASPTTLDGSAPFSVPADYGVDSWGTSGKLDIDLHRNAALTSITAYRSYNGAWSVEDGTPVNVFLVRNRVEHDQFTEELRLNGKLLDETLNLTIGGFLLHANSHYGGRIALSLVQFVEDDDIEDNTYAGFGNVDYELIKGLNLIAGVRYTWQEKVFHYGRPNIAGENLDPLVEEIDGQEVPFEGSVVDYRGAIQYRWIPELMTYAQVSTGFRGGGANPRPYNVTQLLPHGQETLTGLEVGAKSDWLKKKLQVNGALFFNIYDDILVTVTQCPTENPVPCWMPINAGTAHVMGGELEALARPTEELGFDGSLSYLYFKYKSISKAGESSGVDKDSKAPYAPELQFSLGVRYDIYLGPVGSEWGILTPRLDLSYQDEFFTNPSNSLFSRIDKRVLLNGRLAWTSSDELWVAAFEVTNITNEIYYYGVQDNRIAAGGVVGHPAPPREWAISLRRNFF